MKHKTYTVDHGAVRDEDCGEEEHVDISNLPSTQLTSFEVIKSKQLQLMQMALPLRYLFTKANMGLNMNLTKLIVLVHLGGKVVLGVLDVMQNWYPTKKLSLYFDNFFMSLKPSEKVKTMGHDATGTLRKNWVESCPFRSPTKFMKLQRGSGTFL